MQRRKIWKAVVAWAMALALLVPISAFAGEWQTYLRDDFSSAQTMFYTGPLGTAYYGIDESGRYVVDGLTAPGDSMAILTDSLYYYYFETECEVLDTLAGDLASCGLVFHYNKRVRPGQNSYYVFYVYSDGYYGVKRVIGDSDGKVDILIPLAKSEMIDANYPNVLAVDAQGSRFDLYINGKYVDGFTDLAIDGGGFGFYSTKKTKAAYDNFSVKIERRELGRDNLAQPVVNTPGETTESGFSFEGYSPPVIRKDPNRPLYPWEVGYVDPEGIKQTADEPVLQDVPVDPPDSQPVFEPAAEPVRVEPKPEPRHDSGIAQANKVSEPAPKAAAPPPDSSKATEEQSTEVQTHSYGEFSNDGKSPEVEVVSVEAFDEFATIKSDSVPEPEPQLTTPFVAKNPAPVVDAGLPEVDTPKTDIRPDWLLESGPPETSASGSAKDDTGDSPDALPLAPVIAQPNPEESKPVDIKEPTDKEASEPKKEKPIRRRSTGITGNDELWNDGSVDTKDYSKKEKPKEALDLQPGTEAETSPNELAPATPDQIAGDSLDDSGKDGGQLSLFPTGEKAVEQVEAKPIPSPDTPDVIATQVGQQPPQKVDVLSFREATASTASDKSADAANTQSGEATGSSPEAQTPVIETEVVIVEASKLIPPETDIPQTKETPVDPPSPKPQVPENLPVRQTESTAGQETTLPLFTPATPAEEALERPEQRPQITIIDDFSEQTWPIGDNGISSYRYFGAAYEIDNRIADTMAISFQQNELESAQYTVESEFLDGISDVGYGLAAHFQINGGNASYYGLFISNSGEYLLLKVVGGQEKVLVDWMPCNLLKPNSPNVISLEISSPSIKVFINGKLITTVLDSSLRSGGYALLAGPGVAARFDNLVVNGDPRK